MNKKASKDLKLIADLQKDRLHEDRALATIYKDNRLLIEHFILKNGGSREESKDIFQETIISFYENVKENKYRGESSISSYIYSIARFKWLNRQKRKNIEKIIIDTTEFDEKQQTFLPRFLKEENKRQVFDLFKKLGNNCQEILIYSLYYEYSMKEIVKKFGFSGEQVVRNTKYKCLKKLKEMIREKPVLMKLLKKNS